MTISEYMNNLTLESMAVANEMACDSMLCDLYAANYDEDASAAYESVDLAFDDEDVDGGYYAEPATEAGFFKSLGNKFKSMLETIKGWFEKVASTIKGWITKFIDRIKSKVQHAKEKNQAKKIAGIEADANASLDDSMKRGDELQKKLDRISEQMKNETNASKRQQLNKEYLNIQRQLKETSEKATAVFDSRAISLGKVYAQNINEGIKKAENAFKIACKDQKTIEDMLLKIMNTKVSPKNKKSELVGERITYDTDGNFVGSDKAVAALKKVKGAEGMRKDLEKMLDNLDTVSQNVNDGVTAANDAFAKFNEACDSEFTKMKVMQKVNFRLPSADLTAKAEYMAKECLTYAKETESLAKLFGDAPAEDSTEKDKRPEIAKTLSAYSKVASKLVEIANSYLKLANKSEVAVMATEAF